MLVEDVRRKAKERHWRCALIVTALDLELQAVVAHIEPLASVKGRGGAIYECGAFHDVGQDWLIVVADRMPERIQRKTPSQTRIWISSQNFRFLSALAARGKEDVPAGSVVVADHVYMPYSGKYGENGFSARPREFAADPQLLEVARKVRRDKKWVQRIRDPADSKLPLIDEYPVKFPPLGHIAPAVSTESVLANKDSDLAKSIPPHNMATPAFSRWRDTERFSRHIGGQARDRRARNL